MLAYFWARARRKLDTRINLEILPRRGRLGPVTQGRPQPGIEAAMMHQQHAAHHAHPEQAPMRFDEGVLYLASLAKYAVAFFRMSRSSVTRANSAFKRRISAASAASCRICRSGL